MSQDGPRWPQAEPQWPQDGPKIGQHLPESALKILRALFSAILAPTGVQDDPEERYFISYIVSPAPPN